MGTKKKISASSSSARPAVKHGSHAGAGKRVRKPLTDEQRKLKNAKARLRRILGRTDARASRTMSDEDRRRLEAMDRRELEEHYRNMCLKCSPECRNYDKCKWYARTTGIPVLHEAAPVPPVTPRTEAERDSVPRTARYKSRVDVFDGISAWLRESIGRFVSAGDRCLRYKAGSSFVIGGEPVSVSVTFIRRRADGSGLSGRASGSECTSGHCRGSHGFSDAMLLPVPFLFGIDWAGDPVRSEQERRILDEIRGIVRSRGWDESYG